MANFNEEVQNISRLDLCYFMHNNDVDFTDKTNQLTAIFNYILEMLKISVDKIATLSQNQLKSSIRDFVKKVVDRYKAQNKHFKRLVENIKPTDFLGKDFKVPDLLPNYATKQPAKSFKAVKRKTFSEKSTRGQYLEAQQMRKNHEVGAINLAASLSLKKEGKQDARFVFQKINSSTGLTAAKARAAISKGKSKDLAKITPFQGLAFLLNHNLTRSQYNAIREICKNHGASIWPSYKDIQNAKQQCRPSGIEATDH